MTEEETAIGEGIQDFAFRLVKESLAQKEGPENMLVSPLSAGILLSALANGCVGKSLDEICTLLGLKPSQLSTLNSYNRKLAGVLTAADDSVKLQSSNAVWLQYSFPVLRSFISDCQNYYDTEVKGIDFADKEAGSAINRWCREKTNDLIERIVDDGPQDCELAMANAIYFKAPWTDGFRKEETKAATFTNEDGTKSEVQMMWKTDPLQFRYATAKDFDMVALSFGQYLKKSYSMVIGLPHEGVSLKACINGLDASVWSEAVSRLKGLPVELALPRFKVEDSFQMKKVLQTMGVTCVFDMRLADFSRLSSQALSVSEIKQKTTLTVNEKGAEAAAVTFTHLATDDGKEPTFIPFHIDRPFFFAITENIHGNILFMGVVRKM